MLSNDTKHPTQFCFFSVQCTHCHNPNIMCAVSMVTGPLENCGFCCFAQNGPPTRGSPGAARAHLSFSTLAGDKDYKDYKD
jgi:hypothetical protein